MAFKVKSGTAAVAETPEMLFSNLRGKKIAGLLVQQGDVLRDYVARAQSESDVALQLPTGAGKTLVGLLLAEWRRQKFGERAMYLCLTNQLVHQVVGQATEKYGLGVTAFTGKKLDYPPEHATAFMNGDTVAVTSYASLFNVRPFFEDPQVIVLDDAHATEQFIAGFWTVRIDRREHAALFSALAGALRDTMPVIDFAKIAGDDATAWDEPWVDKIPTPYFAPLIPELVGIIDVHAQEGPLSYQWGVLRDHLSACHLYVGVREMLIRPLLPPTGTHSPFAGATQRIYMSATLGAGGELERLSGRGSVFRLDVPRGWERHGIGRRFFMFPGSSIPAEESDDVIQPLIRTAGRALLLTPTDAQAVRRRGWVEKELGCPTFNAREIEQSKQRFVETAEAVAVIANRYEGIDFVEDECRLIILEGLPRALNLQERFLMSRMGAVALLNDRILTRIVQAVGRCTRTANDYAAVIIADEKLHHYLLKSERRAFLHPELQAELQFGIDQSKGSTPNDFIENLQAFLDQGKEWAQADAEILRLRDVRSQGALPGTADLRAAAPHEIEYQEAMWRGDPEGGLEAARQVLTALTDPELRGYRALWLYLAGSAAWLGADTGIEHLRPVAREYFRDAGRATRALPWLHALARLHSPGDAAPSVESAREQQVVERLETRLEELGMVHDRRFDDEERFILKHLAGSDAEFFEQAHERLGRLIGYEANRSDAQGAPDTWWLSGEDLCFVFEDHSDATAGGTISLKKVRQTGSHPAWVQSHLPVSDRALILPILVSPCTGIDAASVPHADSVQFWPIDEFRSWARDALRTVRELRRTFPGAGDLAWRALALEAYSSRYLTPSKLMDRLRDQPLTRLAVRG